MQAVPVAQLRRGDSPRTAGEVDEHVRVLADIGAVHEPIIVHRASMRVIDGMHRLRAAILRGEQTIAARFFDGCEREAFILAVQQNTAHGYPLSRKDRTTAAMRIFGSHPQWSDRAIARVVGLSAGTVGALRRSMAAQLPPIESRLGHDGRLRPVSPATGRQRAVELITENPDASLRRIAREAGISPRTVRDVRDRLTRGDDPVAPKRPRADPVARTRNARSGGGAGGDGRWLDMLKRDPSLRLTERGRLMLRLLTSAAVLAGARADLLDNLPAHCLDILASAAQECGETWLRFSAELRSRRSA
ncbi:ParB N-terminal domain-containing protein [Dactylosporangium aurantiacum]|uniref:ParB N-terminal domain-containing protein n=1 Tax=Dactylosporangium aurantiacum TaxID=35754 RepID=A0A9Q9ICL0_9ACTN|nr:ParB N-terminal domain-containing protein [Dactylosporangium aurantiacum]MDG6106909.1 helix-turn-helix domain-containing protein [Dactylosporangium aurantiacum]UWZ50728.1 ParB N-terminal domain-containing protein [Dactylosporangium aurantiacum]